MITMDLVKEFRRRIPITRKKEVSAFILDYDSNTKNIIAQVNGKRAMIALNDISIYPKASIKDENIDNLYFNRLLGKQINCEVIGFKDGYILSRAKLMEKKIQKYQKGDIVVATIISASDKALYLEFDEGLSGIMYINQITSAKLKKPLDIYSFNDTIKCKIIKKKDGYFELSRLDLYKSVNLNLKYGDKVKCKITKKLDDGSGYFVEVISNPNISGIFDINNYNRNNRYKVGKIIDLRIVEINNKNQLRLRTL